MKYTFCGVQFYLIQVYCTHTAQCLLMKCGLQLFVYSNRRMSLGSRAAQRCRRRQRQPPLRQALQLRRRCQPQLLQPHPRQLQVSSQRAERLQRSRAAAIQRTSCSPPSRCSWKVQSLTPVYC